MKAPVKLLCRLVYVLWFPVRLFDAMFNGEHAHVAEDGLRAMQDAVQRYCDPTRLAEFQEELLFKYRRQGTQSPFVLEELKADVRKLRYWRFMLFFVSLSNLHIRSDLLLAGLYYRLQDQARMDRYFKWAEEAMAKLGGEDGFHVEGYDYLLYILTAANWLEDIDAVTSTQYALRFKEFDYRDVTAPTTQVLTTDTGAGNRLEYLREEGFEHHKRYTSFRGPDDFFFIIYHDKEIFNFRWNFHVNFTFGAMACFKGQRDIVPWPQYGGYAHKAFDSRAFNGLCPDNQEPAWRLFPRRADYIMNDNGELLVSYGDYTREVQFTPWGVIVKSLYKDRLVHRATYRLDGTVEEQRL